MGSCGSGTLNSESQLPSSMPSLLLDFSASSVRTSRECGIPGPERTAASEFGCLSGLGFASVVQTSYDWGMEERWGSLDAVGALSGMLGLCAGERAPLHTMEDGVISERYLFRDRMLYVMSKLEAPLLC